MAIYTFGAGSLWAKRTDITNATPIKFGVLQSISVDFDATMKELYGSKQFPVAIGRGNAKIQAKAKFGQISGLLFGGLFFGQTPVVGQKIVADSEAATVPAATTYTVTAANAGSNGVNFLNDLGVVYADNGLPLTEVASAPTQGQYSVDNKGVYTFSSSDASASVLLSYEYQDTAAGENFTLSNPDVGIQPVFSIYLQEKYQAPAGLKRATLKLHSCVSSKLQLATKQEDFNIPELDFSAFADQAGNVFSWSFNEAS